MRISEIFESIQGEGKTLGVPSVFIRTSGCNLHCYFCDSAYTWSWNNTLFQHKDGVKYDRQQQTLIMTEQQVVDEVLKYKSKNVVLTGGEPLLQQPALIQVIDGILDKRQSYFEVETAGTLIPTPRLHRQIENYNVSVKLSNSQNPKKLRLKDAPLRFFANTDNAYFKFVVDKPADVDEVIDLQKKYQIPEQRVYLMPQGTTADEILQKQPWIAELCKQLGYNATTRLHILIYGNRRGT